MRASVWDIALLALAASTVGATTYHVAPDSTGDVPNIQAAIDAASSGDEILLSDGVFTGDGNWDLNLGTKELVIRSEHGYLGTFVHCGFQSTWIYPVHRGFLIEGGQTAATKLEGITIERSYGSLDGGSIYCVGASPVISRVRIRQNLRRGGRGGGVYVRGGAPLLEDCVFEPGYDPYFAIEGESIYSEQSFLTLERCSFSGVHSNFAAIVLDGGTIENCAFNRNLGPGDEQGGCIEVSGGKVSILQSSFRATFGVAVWAGGKTLLGTCRFEDNVGDFGPAVSSSGDTTIRNSVFHHNYAGINAAAIDSWGVGLTLDHCVFRDDDDDAIVTSAQNVAVTHCTFVNCGYPGNGKTGSSLLLWGTPRVTVDHTIIAFGKYDACAIRCEGTPVSLDVSCCDIFGNPGGDWVGCLAGMGGVSKNRSVDPLFCSAATGDYSLQLSSPCAPPGSGDCGLIGALGAWCGPVAVEEQTWGKLKSLYR